jgi:hypothetical protein
MPSNAVSVTAPSGDLRRRKVIERLRIAKPHRLLSCSIRRRPLRQLQYQLGRSQRSGRDTQCITACVSPQHFLYFFPLPQGQISRPTFALPCLNDVFTDAELRMQLIK